MPPRGAQCYLGTYDGEHWLQNEPTQCNVAYGFSGGIDDLAVVAGALSAEEIALRWNSSLTERRLAGLEPDMVLLYNFNHPTEHEGYEPNLGSAGSDYDFVFGRLPAQSEYAGSRFRPFTVSGDALEFQPPVRTPNPDPSGRAVPKPPDPAAPTVLTARAGEALTLVAPDGARRSIVAPASWSPDAPDASGTLVVELAPADAGGSNTTFHVVPRLAPRGPPDGVRPFFTTGNTVEDRPLVIRLLSAASPNGAPLGANVTTVPTRGALYALPYASSTLAEGTLITHAGCLIPGPQPVVMYVPEPNGAGFPLDTLAYSVVDEADATLESAPTVVPINVEGLDDAPVVSVPSLSLVEDAHAGGVLVSLNASDQEVGTPLDVFITQLPTKGTLFRLPDNVPITNPYSAFEIGEVVTQYVDEVVEVSSFWGNPPYAGYHPMHVIGPPDCSSFGECESEAAWREDVALPVPLGTKVLHPAGDGLIGRVLEVDEADPTRVHIEYHPMYRRNATSDEWYQCHMDPLGPKSYPGRCLRELAPADGGAVRAWVPRDSISPSVGNVWCPLNRALVDDVDLTGGGAFGPQYRYSHNPSHTYAAGGYSEFIVVRFAQPVYVVVVEIGSSRGMGGIVGVRAQAEDGEWVELYSGAAMRDVADEYTRTDRYWRWAPPRTCRPHFTADTLRIEIDTSSQTGVSDWNYIDYIKLVGARELQPASLYSGELRVRYVPHAHAHGTDSFAVVASDCPGDAFSESSEKHVAVRIDERNDAPTAESVVIDGVISEEMETALVVYDVDEADTASDLVVRISHMPSFGTLRDGLGRTVRAVGHELPPDARSLSFVAASIDGATETALNAFNRTIGIALVGYTVTDLAGLVAEATVIFRVLDPTEPQAVLCEAGEELRSGHCRPCADGYVAGSAGINRCEACPAGSYAYDRRTCPPCDSTEYQDEEAQLECRACPANSAYLEASGVPHLPFVTLRGATARSNCTCEEGFYAPEWAARGSECLPCPVGAVCEGTGFSDVVVPTPVKGYFERAATRHVMLRCASTLACPGGGLELCGDGFTGDVCSDCVQGHFSWHGGCYPCETQNRITAAIVVVVFVLALFAIHTTANLERENDKGGLLMSSTVSAAAEIQGVIFFSQMLNLMLETSVAWPESVREFLAAFSIANIDLSVFAPECQYESIGFVRRWQLQCTMPFIFMAAYAAHVLLSAWPRALYALRHKPWAERFRRCRLIVYRAVNAVVLTMSLLYIHTARIALAGLPIACTRQPDGSRTMVGYPAIDCDGEEFRERVLPVAATTSALVVAAYPIVLALFFFFAADVKSSDAWRRCTMIVRIPYKRRWYFWECVDLLRKLLVGVVLAFAGPLGAGTQVAMISLIVLLALVLQMAARPFKHVLVNSLSIYLLFVLLIILVIGGTVYNNPTGVAPAVRTVFDVLVYTSVGSVLILAAVHLMHVFYVYVRSRDLGVISHSLLEMLPSPMRLAVSERMSVHDVSGSPRELNRVSAFLSPTRTGGRANRRSFTTHQVRTRADAAPTRAAGGAPPPLACARARARSKPALARARRARAAAGPAHAVDGERHPQDARGHRPRGAHPRDHRPDGRRGPAARAQRRALISLRARVHDRLVPGVGGRAAVRADDVPGGPGHELAAAPAPPPQRAQPARRRPRARRPLHQRGRGGLARGRAQPRRARRRARARAQQPQPRGERLVPHAHEPPQGLGRRGRPSEHAQPLGLVRPRPAAHRVGRGDCRRARQHHCARVAQGLASRARWRAREGHGRRRRSGHVRRGLASPDRGARGLAGVQQPEDVQQRHPVARRPRARDGRLGPVGPSAFGGCRGRRGCGPPDACGGAGEPAAAASKRRQRGRRRTNGCVDDGRCGRSPGSAARRSRGRGRGPTGTSQRQRRRRGGERGLASAAGL